MDNTKQIKTVEDLQAEYEKETKRRHYANNCLLYLIWLENKLINPQHPVPAKVPKETAIDLLEGAEPNLKEFLSDAKIWKICQWVDSYLDKYTSQFTQPAVPDGGEEGIEKLSEQLWQEFGHALSRAYSEATFAVDVYKILQPFRHSQPAGNDAVRFAEWIGGQGLFNGLSLDNIRRWHKMIGNSKAKTTSELYQEYLKTLTP